MNATALYGMIVAGAILASAATPTEDRGRLLPCALGLAVGWVDYVTSWSANSLDMRLTRMGLFGHVHSVDLWALGRSAATSSAAVARSPT